MRTDNLDFFDSAETLTIDARAASGLPEPARERHVTAVLERAMNWLKHKAFPATMAVVIGTSALVTPFAHAQTAEPDAARPAAVQVEKDLANPANPLGVLEVYRSIKAAESGSASAAEMQARGLYEKTVSSEAKKSVSEFIYHSSRAIQSHSNSPHLMPVKDEVHGTVCILNMVNFDGAMGDLLGSSFKNLSGQQHEDLKTWTIVHEAAHCEQASLEDAAGNFAAVAHELSHDFRVEHGDAQSFWAGGEFGTLMKERYADAKTSLVMAREHLGSLSEKSSPAQVKSALERFDAAMHVGKLLRQSERDHNLEYKEAFNNHDTLHVLQTIQSLVHHKTSDMSQWADWSARHLKDNDAISALSGKIAVGSSFQERNEIASSMMDTYKGMQQDAIKSSTEKIAENGAQRDELHQRIQEQEKLFKAELQARGENEISAGDYITLVNAFRIEKIDALKAQGMSTDQAQEAASSMVKDQFPSLDLANKIYDMEDHLDTLNIRVNNAQETLAKAQGTLSSLQAAGQNFSPRFAQDLSSASSAYAMTASHEWQAMQKEAGTSHLPSYITQYQAQNDAQAHSEHQAKPSASDSSRSAPGSMLMKFMSTPSNAKASRSFSPGF